MPLETPEQKKTSKTHTRTLLPSVNPVQNTAKIIYKDEKDRTYLLWAICNSSGKSRRVCKLAKASSRALFMSVSRVEAIFSKRV